jgi:raffinose/stachyose/melibiose transport system permease protein
MLVQNTIGLLLAVALNAKILPGRTFYRTLLYSPAVISVVIVGFIWKLMLNPLWGIVEGFMRIIHIDSLFRPWLGLPSSVLITLILISCWQYVGVPMMLFLTALIGIPEEIQEAALVDGANNWKRFWHVQLPLIMPTVGVVTILTFTGTFNAFDLIYAVKNVTGDPNFASDVLGLYYFRTFFGDWGAPGNPTMGSAIAVTTLMIILTGVVLYLLTWQRRLSKIEVSQ